MQPAIDLASIILLIGSVQGVFFALILLNTRGAQRHANRYLAIFLLLLALTLVDEFMTWTRYYLSFPHLLGLIWPTNFLFAPFAYFYVKSLTSIRTYTPGKTIWLHFIPAFIDVVYNLPNYLLPAEQKIALLFRSGQTSLAHLLELDTFGPILQMLIYLLISIRLLNAHRNNIKDSFSQIERINLLWLRNLLIALFILWIIYLFTEMASPWMGMIYEAWYALHLMVVVVIFALGYLGVRQPAIFSALQHQDQSHTAEQTSHSAADESDTAASISRDKYRKSALTKSQSETILHSLHKAMTQQKPYLEGDLNLPKLAEILEISPHHLSQVINERLEVNFFDFINRYRVEEAKQQLAKTQRRRPNILTIALDAGFNSKSAFYTAFKRHTEMTPSQFRKMAISGS